MDLVKVVWKDAWVDGNEPINVEEAHLKHKPMLMTTLGWLLIDNAEGVSVANEHYIDDAGMEMYRGRTFIPRGMVQSLEPLIKPKAPRKPRIPKTPPVTE